MRYFASNFTSKVQSMEFRGKNLIRDFLLNFVNVKVIYFDLQCVCVCVSMPTHCTITCFGFHARWIDGVKCGLFSNHAPLGQTTLHVGRVSV